MPSTYVDDGQRIVVREDYLDLLISAKDTPDLVKIIYGVRRCGKSTLMDQFACWLEGQGIPSDRIIRYDLESIDDRDVTSADIYDRVRAGRGEGMRYMLIDEIQRLEDWMDCLSRLADERGLDVYVTGSNAFILSSELKTFLTGREFEVKMLPLSFKEFLALNPVDPMTDRNARFMQYMRWGGMPAVDLAKGPRFNLQLLQGIFSDILLKDVAHRLSGKSDTMKLSATASFLLDNIGNLSNINRMAKGAKVDHKTMANYLDKLMEAFVLCEAKRYDIVGNRILNGVEKYYAVDLGLRNAVLGNAAGNDLGRPLENLVYIELLRRGYTVSVGCYRDREVDFTASRDGETELYQVALTMMDDDTFDRESRSLIDMKNGYPKTILTLDTVRREPGYGVKHINVIDWLLS